jgi:uncharacterized membrane protein
VCPILVKDGLQDSVTCNLYAPNLATLWMYISSGVRFRMVSIAAVGVVVMVTIVPRETSLRRLLSLVLTVVVQFLATILWPHKL